MDAQITIHRVIDGHGVTVGWAVLRDLSEKLSEFETIEDACAFAESDQVGYGVITPEGDACGDFR